MLNFNVKDWKCWFALVASVITITLITTTNVLELSKTVSGIFQIIIAVVSTVSINLGITLFSNKDLK